MKQTITNPKCYLYPTQDSARCAVLSWFNVEDLDTEVGFNSIKDLLTHLDYEQRKNNEKI